MTESANQQTHLDEELDAILVGGREPVTTVTIADYDETWPDRFALERDRLRAALGSLARRIEHIGSTSVPGLAAKPIVDILVEVDQPEDEASYRPALEACGYELRVREPRHRMFRTLHQDVHVHLWPTGCDETTDYLVLRDWLRTHPDDRLLYQRTKQGLANRSWRDMNYYAEAKGPVIAGIMGRAAGARGPAERAR